MEAISVGLIEAGGRGDKVSIFCVKNVAVCFFALFFCVDYMRASEWFGQQAPSRFNLENSTNWPSENQTFDLRLAARRQQILPSKYSLQCLTSTLYEFNNACHFKEIEAAE